MSGPTRLRLGFVLAAAVAASSCATLQNTPAQDLAWERWQACKSSGVVLNRITPEGQIWVTYTADHGTALREWRLCDRKVAAEQAEAARAAKAAKDVKR